MGDAATREDKAAFDNWRQSSQMKRAHGEGEAGDGMGKAPLPAPVPVPVHVPLPLPVLVPVEKEEEKVGRRPKVPSRRLPALM